MQFISEGTHPVEIPSVPGSTITITISPENPDEPVQTQLTCKIVTDCVEEETSKNILYLTQLLILFCIIMCVTIKRTLIIRKKKQSYNLLCLKL